MRNFMKKRGQVSFKVILSALISLVILGVLFFSFKSIQDVNEQRETYELLNFKTSIETKVLQQSFRAKGSFIDFSLSAPTSVSKVCFFDSSNDYDYLRNPEIVDTFSDDEVNNLFILVDGDYFPYHIDNIEIEESKNPTCAKIVNNKLTLKLTSINQKTQIGVEGGTEDINCISVLENGNPSKKIDITFLGYGFEDISEYNSQVNRYINNILLEFEPFSDYRDKFNFYRIDDAKIGCNIGSFIKCDQYEIKLAASDCPSDYIFLLVDRNVVADFISPVRSSAIGNIAKINTADKPFVLVHEFGHSFGDLADEYVDEDYYSTANFNARNYANCDSSPCTLWQGVDDSSCYEGCSLGMYFRSTETSIMRKLSSPDFGSVNERELLKRLLYYE